MKKYWRVIAITVVMIVSVGIFYIQSTIAANKFPQFSIEKISGEEQEIDSLVIRGMYHDNTSPGYEYMELSLEDSSYMRQQSLFERLADSHFPSQALATLVKDHRNFMRGKGWSNFVIEDERIVHVDMIYKYEQNIKNKFVISMLDKTTKKKTSFEHNIKTDHESGWIDILKIQVTDDQLKIVTKNEVVEQGNQNWKVHLYTFDLVKQELTNEEELFQLSDEQHQSDYVSTNLLEETGTNNNGNKIVFIKDFPETIIDEEGFVVEEISDRTLIVYDLETKNHLEIDIEEMLDYGYPQFYDDEHIYFTDVDPEQGTNVHVYRLADEEIINTLTIKQPEGVHGPYMTMDDGKLILVNTYKDMKTPAYITVVDIVTEEMLYQGEIVNKDIKQNFELDMHAIGFK